MAKDDTTGAAKDAPADAAKDTPKEPATVRVLSVVGDMVHLGTDKGVKVYNNAIVAVPNDAFTKAQIKSGKWTLDTEKS